MVGKTWNGKFFKKSYLFSQFKEGGANNYNSNSKANTIQDATMPEQWSNWRSSSVDDIKCVICNEMNYIKGRLVSLLNMILLKPGDSRHEAKKILTEYGKIYLEKNDKGKEITKMIILTGGVITLFAASVSYIQDCCQKF